MESRLKSAVLEQLRRPVTPDSYRQIRELWIKHSVSEDKRDIPGLMSTLTDECVYVLVQNGVEWRGHAGATRFYSELLTAFPDIHFDLQNIVIGPQGVWEEARVTGTHQAQWLDYAPTGKHIEFNVSIFFPWDPEKKLFSGERVWTDADSVISEKSHNQLL